MQKKESMMNEYGGLRSLLKELTSEEERDSDILQEKISLMKRVAVDHLYEDACGHVVSYKASAILGLAAHKDERCRGLILTYLKGYNLTLKSSALLAAGVLRDKSLCGAIAELFKEGSTIIRIQAMECLLALSPSNLEKYLLPLINDPVWYVREKLASVLEEKNIGHDLLKVLQKDRKIAVRSAAESAFVHSPVASV